MAYTTPRTWNAETVTAAKWNIEIRDNQQALKDPPCQNYEANQGGDYSTSSSSWSNVDGTNMNFSITTNGGDVMIGFIGTVAGGATGLIDVAVDGTRIVNQATGGLIFLVTDAGAKTHSFVRLVQGLSAGVHTFALQWRSLSGTITLYAGAGTANYDVHPQFWVRELT